MLYKFRKQIISILIAIPLIWGIYLLVKPDTDIHIALVGPMSGKDSANGKSYLEGVKLYVDSINEKGELTEGKLLLMSTMMKTIKIKLSLGQKRL